MTLNLRSLALALVALAAATARATDLPCQPNANGVVYTPGNGAFGTLLFEDLWPDAADFDFNDESVAYNFVQVQDSTGKTLSLQATLQVLTAGGGLHNGLYLHLPVPASAASLVYLNVGGLESQVAPVAGETDLVIPLVADTRSLFGSIAGFINTTNNAVAVGAAPMSLRVAFAAPVALSAGLAPFDLFIARSDDYSHQIHLPQYAGTAKMNTALFGTSADGSRAGWRFVNKLGMPYALNVPALVRWPLETVSIDQVYPSIVTFAASGGLQATGWYLSLANPSLAWSGGANNSILAAPAVADAGFAVQQTSCKPPASCAKVNGVQWCYNATVCGQACNDVCSSLGMAVAIDDTTWFNAQNTTARCQAIATAFGMSPVVNLGSYAYACVEDTWGTHPNNTLYSPLLCSTYSGCPALHRTHMDQQGIACGSPYSRRSICPCQ